MSNWLSNRLTPSKIKEARWVEISTVLEHVWEEFFDPGISRLERLRSAYTADDADLIKKIREMGDYFAFDWPKMEDRPIGLAWRRLELEYKDMEVILDSVFRRHFGGLPTAWLPIFAPLDQDYGIGFKVAEGPLPERQTVPPEGMFLTSRGRLGADWGHLLKIGVNRQKFRESAYSIVRRVKPLHICFEGLLWYIFFDLPFQCDFDVSWEVNEPFELYFAPLGSRYDFTPDAERCADTCVFTLHKEIERQISIQFIPDEYALWRLDIFYPEGFPLELNLLDKVFPGYEGMPLGFFHFVPHVHVDHSTIRFKMPDCRFAKNEKLTNLPSSIFHSNINLTIAEIEEIMECRMPESYLYLDQHPIFDELPADFCPLDYPHGGNIYA